METVGIVIVTMAAVAAGVVIIGAVCAAVISAFSR